MGNFRGRKLSRISRFFSHPRKFSPRNSRHATPIMRPILTSRESFLRKMILSYRSAKVFSLENFPLYGNVIMSHGVISQLLKACGLYHTVVSHVPMCAYLVQCYYKLGVFPDSSEFSTIRGKKTKYLAQSRYIVLTKYHSG